MGQPGHHLETLALHAGQTVDSDTLGPGGPVSTRRLATISRTPITPPGCSRTAGVRQHLHAADEPDHRRLEKRLAALEGGVGGLALARGQSAIYVSISSTSVRLRRHMVSSNSLYGGTVTCSITPSAKLGIDVTFVDPKDPQNFARAIGTTHLVYIETDRQPEE